MKKDVKFDPQDIKNKVSKEFNLWATTYDSGVTNLFFHFTINEIKKFVNLGGKNKLLDVGCGTGNLLLEINKNSKDSILYGIDLSPKMIQIAKSKSENSKNISFKIGSGDKLPYESNFFDYVICSHSLHHHPNPEKSLIEINRVLKPEGTLIVVDGFTNGILRKINFFITKIVQNESFVQRFKKQEMFGFFKKLKYKNISQKEILYFNLLTKGIKAP